MTDAASPTREPQATFRLARRLGRAFSWCSAAMMCFAAAQQEATCRFTARRAAPGLELWIARNYASISFTYRARRPEFASACARRKLMRKTS